MKRSPAFISFLQVAGVFVYILALTGFVNLLDGSNIEPSIPMLAATLFLLAFVTSALICSSLVLGYPVYLFLSGEKRQAVEIVAWSIFWFIFMLLLTAAAAFLS